MSKIGFKLGAGKTGFSKGDTQVNCRVITAQQVRVTRIVLRKDEDVRNSQVKGYKYLLP